jgi:2-hydroxy-3-oxopropionate reductase
MGAPMAGHVLKGHGALTVLDARLEATQPLLRQGASRAATPRALADACDVVITMLPDTGDVEAVLFGESGLAAGLAHGSVVIDMSTVSPVATRRWWERLSASGIRLLDAPVSGGLAGAESGRLSVMVGGEEAVFDEVRPILEYMAATVVHVGPSGAGQTTKACNQIAIGNTLLGIAEALNLAERSGLDIARVRDVLLAGAAQSRVLELGGQRMLDDDYEGGFRTALHLKDLRLGLEAAEAVSLDVPGTRNVFALLQAMQEAGAGNRDHAALFAFLREKS